MANRSRPRPASPPPPAAKPGNRWLRLAAFVAGATVLAVGAWGIGNLAGLGAHGQGDQAASPSPSLTQKFGPQVVDAKRITGLPEELGHPVFWAGPAPQGQFYELTIAADDSVAIRYLDDADQAGEGQARLVATFARENAYQVLTEQATGAGWTAAAPAPGWLVVQDNRDTLTGYLAIEGVGYLAQVFDPQPDQTWEMLNATKIEPIPAG